MAHFELVIRMNQKTGGISVQGPLEQRMLCYGMLEMAKAEITKRAQEQDKSNIVIPGMRVQLPGNGGR